MREFFWEHSKIPLADLRRNGGTGVDRNRRQCRYAREHQARSVADYR